jgi:hypothetical protein
VSEDAIVQAAGDAVMSLIDKPRAYDPRRGELISYLRMAAQADLCNLLRNERRHHRRRIGLESVELSPDAGKYLGREDDPSLGLRRAEEEAELRKSVPDSFFAECDEVDRTFLRLFLAGEKRTRTYVEALGWST